MGFPFVQALCSNFKHPSTFLLLVPFLNSCLSFSPPSAGVARSSLESLLQRFIILIIP